MDLVTRRGLLLLLAIALVVPSSLLAGEYYSSPTGTAQGDGTRAAPWDLQGAIGPATKLRAGDTLWLLPGTYRGNFESHAGGSAEAPVIIRSDPSGQATIDGLGEVYPLHIRGGHVVYRDLEIIQSSTWHAEAETPVAVQCVAPHVKLINLIIHDAGQGIGSWMGAHAMEAYGCLIYNNGLRPLEHGIYAQNDIGTGIKRFENNIIFNNSGFGIHAYTRGGQLTGFEFIGNILFNNGAKRGPGAELDNLFVGGSPPADRILARENLGVFTGNTRRFNFRFSYQDHQQNPHGSLVAAENVMVGGTTFVAEDWRHVTFTNNLMASAAGFAQIRPPPGVAPADYHWNLNRYYGAGTFNSSGRSHNFDEWTRATGLDSQSRHGIEITNGVHVTIRPNRYESNRAHIAILNWAKTNMAPVDLAGVLQPNTPFQLRNVQDYFGTPVLSGTYDGKPLLVPLTNLAVALPKGPSPPPSSTAPFFNVFILRTSQHDAGPRP